jgi:hypothetical protein
MIIQIYYTSAFFSIGNFKQLIEYYYFHLLDNKTEMTVVGSIDSELLRLKGVLYKKCLFKVVLIQVCSWNCENTPMHKNKNAYIAIKWNLNLLVITFSTTLTLLARVISRNDASPSDGDNTRLVCVRGDQCHDHIKDIRKRVD